MIEIGDTVYILKGDRDNYPKGIVIGIRERDEIIKVLPPQYHDDLNTAMGDLQKN